MKNEIACHVKLAELSDNMDLSRLQNHSEDDFHRVEKYQKAAKRIRDHLKFDIDTDSDRFPEYLLTLIDQTVDMD